MTVGCVADIDVAVSVLIILQGTLCKSLQVVSKVLVFVFVAPVFVDIAAVNAVIFAYLNVAGCLTATPASTV